MPAVLALAPVIAALMALLIIMGIHYLTKLIADVMPEGINVGGFSIHLRGLIEGAIDAIFGTVEGIFGAFIRPVIGFILRPVIEFINWLTNIGVFVVTAANQLYWIIHTVIPGVIKIAKAYAAALYARAKSYALSLYHRATHYAYTLVHAARVYAAALVASAIKHLDAAIRAARLYAHGLVAAEAAARVTAVDAVRTYAHDLYGVTRTEIGTAVKGLENEIKAITSISPAVVSTLIAEGVQAAEDYASAAVATGIGALTTDVEQVVEGLFDGLITDVGALAGVLGTDLPDIGALLDDIPLSIPLDIAGTIGLSLALDRIMVRYLQRCGVPNCRNLGALGHFLQDLLGAASLAGLLAMLTEMITDPEGAAATARDELGGLVSEAQDLATSLLGV